MLNPQYVQSLEEKKKNTGEQAPNPDQKNNDEQGNPKDDYTGAIAEEEELKNA